MTEAQRYNKLCQLFPLAQGATVDELIESQVRLMAHAQAERTWHTQQVYQSPQGATPQQVPPGDKP